MSEGFVELEDRSVPGIGIGQENRIEKIFAQPVGVSDGDHLVVNSVDDECGLLNRS